MSVDPVFLVLDRLSGVKQRGDEWSARCPAHDDKHPSLCVSRGNDGRALIYCATGCHAEDVVSAIGLDMKDLFVPSDPVERKHYAKLRSRKELVEVLGHELLVMEQIYWMAQRIELPEEDVERGMVAAARIKQVMEKIDG
jgi:hypothetical protein